MDKKFTMREVLSLLVQVEEEYVSGPFSPSMYDGMREGLKKILKERENEA